MSATEVVKEVPDGCPLKVEITDVDVGATKGAVVDFDTDVIGVCENGTIESSEFARRVKLHWRR